MTATSNQVLRDAYIELIKRAANNYLYLGAEKSFESFSSISHYDVTAGRWKIDACCRPMTLLGKGQLDLIEEAVLTLERNEVPGDYIEAGVWRGGVIALLRALTKAYGIEGRKILAADSFCGIPLSRNFRGDPVDGWADRWVASLDEVRHGIRRMGLLDEMIEFVPGAFLDTLASLSDRRFALIRLDSDSYESTYVSLERLYPSLSPGGFVIIDDWHLPGCMRAVIEYRACKNIGGKVSLRDGNAFWVKT